MTIDIAAVKRFGAQHSRVRYHRQGRTGVVKYAHLPVVGTRSNDRGRDASCQSGEAHGNGPAIVMS